MRRFPWLSLIPILPVLAGCGGGGSGATPLPPVAARIHFPSGGLVGDDLEVLGTADPATTPFAGLRVNGVLATSDDGFATWRAGVHLVPGFNRIRVDAVLPDGRVAPDVASVTVRAGEALLGAGAQPRLLGGGLYVHSRSLDNGSILLRANPLTGAREALSRPPLPHLTYILDNYGLTASPWNGRLYTVLFTAPPSQPVLWAVDLETQSATEVSGPNTGSGPLSGNSPVLPAPSGDVFLFAYPHFQNQIFQDTVIRVSVATGDRTVVSSDSVGSGPPVRMVMAGILPDGDLVILSASDPSSLLYSPWHILRLDPSTGVRTILVPATPNQQFQRLVVTTGGHIIVWDLASNQLLRVDPGTGVLAPLAGPGLGQGPFPASLFGMVAGADGRVLISEPDAGRILVLDPVTGDRSVADERDGPRLPAYIGHLGSLEDGTPLLRVRKSILRFESVAQGARLLSAAPDPQSGTPGRGDGPGPRASCCRRKGVGDRRGPTGRQHGRPGLGAAARAPGPPTPAERRRSGTSRGVPGHPRR